MGLRPIRLGTVFPDGRLRARHDVVQGYLAYEKPHHPRTLPYAYGLGPRGVLGGWTVSCGRSTPLGVGFQRRTGMLFSLLHRHYRVDEPARSKSKGLAQPFTLNQERVKGPAGHHPPKVTTSMLSWTLIYPAGSISEVDFLLDLSILENLDMVHVGWLVGYR